MCQLGKLAIAAEAAGLLGLLGVVLGLPAASVWAEDFRILTRVYAGEAKTDDPADAEPVAETLTIFADGVAYDFLTSGKREEITIFDPKQQRIVLLDPHRRLQTVLSFDQILSFVAQVKLRLEETGREAFANPTFEVQTPEPAGASDQRLILSSPTITYEVEGESTPARELVDQYYAFADWYARLNTMRPGNAPPFARLRVNAELAERQWIPRRVLRRVVFDGMLRKRTQVMRSIHQTTRLVSQSDRKRIERATTAAATYRMVPLRIYLDLHAGTH